MEFSELVKKLECSTDEFYNALALYLEVNQEDFLEASAFWINEWRKPLDITDRIYLI